MKKKTTITTGAAPKLNGNYIIVNKKTIPSTTNSNARTWANQTNTTEKMKISLKQQLEEEMLYMEHKQKLKLLLLELV